MNISDWYAEGAYFEHKNFQVFYRTTERAGAPSLVLLHGFPTASWDWHKLWEPLSERFQLIALDFLGFGYSDKPRPYSYTIHEQADIVVALLENLGIQQYHLLAHDYGDTVAQELLAREKEREEPLGLQSAVLLNGGIFIESTRPRLIQRLLISPLGPYLSPFLSKRTLKRNFQRIFGASHQPTSQELDEWWHLITHKQGKGVFHLLIRYMEERAQYRERWVGALTEAPVLVQLIYGVEDPISGENIAARYRELVPAPNVISLEGVGHYPSTESPTLLLNHFFEFHDNL
jgi:pimeloyl-ACP methyl ester carboxylesterase